MGKKLLGFISGNLAGVSWFRVLAFVFMGTILFFSVRYVWIGRPAEFYRNGLAAGVEAQKLECEKQEREKNEEIFKHTQAEQKRREKILSSPDVSPNAALLLMRSGRL